MRAKDLSSDLLAWYDRCRRELPWRARAGDLADPYRVWLSEIMLQQTTVGAVQPYFLKFLARWPTIGDLAGASLDDVLKAWAGLGYYARARNLHRCAQAVAAGGGEFPRTANKLQELPGIGPYTAGAIAAIAFGEPEPAVDGNVERVIARLRGIKTPLPQAKGEIRQHVVDLLPAARPGDFAQALMDLGATICTPKSPNCPLCPLMDECEAYRRGIAMSLPRKSSKVSRPVRHGAAYWVERPDGAVLLRRRPEKGLLGGMMEVPSSGWLNKAHAGELKPPIEAEWRKLPAVVEHTFTHFHLVLDIWRADRCADDHLPLDDGYRWVRRERLAQEALPSLMRKVIAAVLPSNVNLLAQ